MLTALRRYAEFRGRSSRSEFWLFVLFVILGEIVTMILDAQLGYGRLDQSWLQYDMTDGWATATAARWQDGFLTLVFWVAMLVPGLAVSVRRLHDGNRSGAWLLIWFLPVFGWLVLLIFTLQPSWPIANRWGTPPAPAA